MNARTVRYSNSVKAVTAFFVAVVVVTIRRTLRDELTLSNGIIPVNNHAHRGLSRNLKHPAGKDQGEIEKHAIVSLLESDQVSIDTYCLVLKSLVANKVSHDYNPVIVFHEDDFPSEAQPLLRSCTSSPVHFYKIAFDFPPGFDAVSEYAKNPKVARQGTSRGPNGARGKWGYVKMIRFWTSEIWKHPAISGGDLGTIMRLDTDACFLAAADDDDIEDLFLPGVRGKYAFRTDNIGIGKSDDIWTEGLFDFAKNYMKKEGLTPRNKELWKFVEATWSSRRALPIYFKNPEVSRVSFFLETDVMKWHDALTEKEPFGVFRHRWSDSVTRVLTMAMFSEPEWVLIKNHKGYEHGKACISSLPKYENVQVQQLTTTADTPEEEFAEEAEAEIEVLEKLSFPQPMESAISVNSDIDHAQHAIVTLLTADEKSTNDYCYSLRTLTDHGILKPNSPLLVFHEDEFLDANKNVIRQCTTNPLHFHLVDFSFPPDFNPKIEIDMGNKVAGLGTKKYNSSRKMWGYAHMIGFYTIGLFDHPAVQSYTTLMRLDSDSCFVASEDENDQDNAYLPGIRGRYVYRTDAMGVGINTWITDLYDFAVWYMNKNSITPRNPALWEQITTTWETDKTLPIFTKNFEVVRVSFFRRKDVMDWHRALTTQEPFGVYRHRWSDANTRVFTMAMFARPEMMLFKKHQGYKHGKECVTNR